MSQEEIKNISNLINPIPPIEGLLEDMDEFFQSMDEKTKKTFLGYKKPKQEKVLKLMKNPELQALWNSLPESKKKQLDKLELDVKYDLLYSMLAAEKKKASAPVPRDTLELKKEDEKADEKADEQTASKHIAPSELFSPEGEKPPVSKTSQQKQLDELVELYYGSAPYRFYEIHKQHELEVRFGTKGIKPLTRIDYDNVIKYLFYLINAMLGYVTWKDDKKKGIILPSS